MPAKKAAKKAGKRTTLRSKSGKKLYAVRDAKGKFKDIQSYKRAHGSDIKRKSKAEKAAAAKKAKKTVKKAAKKTVKRAVKKAVKKTAKKKAK